MQSRRIIVPPLARPVPLKETYAEGGWTGEGITLSIWAVGIVSLTDGSTWTPFKSGSTLAVRVSTMVLVAAS